MWNVNRNSWPPIGAPAEAGNNRQGAQSNQTGLPCTPGQFLESLSATAQNFNGRLNQTREVSRPNRWWSNYGGSGLDANGWWDSADSANTFRPVRVSTPLTARFPRGYTNPDPGELYLTAYYNDAGGGADFRNSNGPASTRLLPEQTSVQASPGGLDPIPVVPPIATNTGGNSSADATSLGNNAPPASSAPVNKPASEPPSLGSVSAPRLAYPPAPVYSAPAPGADTRKRKADDGTGSQTFDALAGSSKEMRLSNSNSSRDDGVGGIGLTAPGALQGVSVLPVSQPQMTPQAVLSKFVQPSAQEVSTTHAMPQGKLPPEAIPDDPSQIAGFDQLSGDAQEEVRKRAPLLQRNAPGKKTTHKMTNAQREAVRFFLARISATRKRIAKAFGVSTGAISNCAASTGHAGSQPAK
jgi:hypothetical protein